MKKVQRRREDKCKRYNVVGRINVKGTTSHKKINVKGTTLPGR
jgi:hypothetical protein